MVITASRWGMVDRKEGQKAVIKEHEFGLITDGPLFYFKFKLKMACKSIIHQKYKRSRFSKLKCLVIGGWRTEKKMLKRQGKFSMRKQETERLWSSPSSAFEGEYWELLSLLFLCPSNPS